MEHVTITKQAVRAGAVVAMVIGGLVISPASIAPAQVGPELPPFEPPPPAQIPTELPPVELSSTTFREGDVITMSGTGCIDPDTGTGDGLVVVLRRPVDMGRGGTAPRLPTITARVATDGTYSGSGTIAPPLVPDGVQQALVTCEHPNPSGAEGEAISRRMVEVTIVAPTLPDQPARSPAPAAAPVRGEASYTG